MHQWFNSTKKLWFYFIHSLFFLISFSLFHLNIACQSHFSLFTRTPHHSVPHNINIVFSFPFVKYQWLYTFVSFLSWMFVGFLRDGVFVCVWEIQRYVPKIRNGKIIGWCACVFVVKTSNENFKTKINGKERNDTLNEHKTPSGIAFDLDFLWVYRKKTDETFAKNRIVSKTLFPSKKQKRNILNV